MVKQAIIHFIPCTVPKEVSCSQAVGALPFVQGVPRIQGLRNPMRETQQQARLA